MLGEYFRIARRDTYIQVTNTFDTVLSNCCTYWVFYDVFMFVATQIRGLLQKYDDVQLVFAR